MSVRRTTPADLDVVNAWLAFYDQEPHPRGLADVPGFIVDGGAACWLLVFEHGCGAMLEFLVAAPGTSGEVRSEAIDAVVAAALDEARQRGLSFIYSTTSHPGVVERSKRHGFNIHTAGLTALRADLGGANG